MFGNSCQLAERKYAREQLEIFKEISEEKPTENLRLMLWVGDYSGPDQMNC